MSAITIRNIPKPVHDKLKAIALKEGVSVEALARDALTEVAKRRGQGGIDFEKLEAVRKELGIVDVYEAWPPHFDDPAFSRHVLGLEEDGEPYSAPEPKTGEKRRK